MPNINIAELLIITGGLQGIIFSFLLFIKLKKDNSKQNLWLALFILFFSLVLVKGWFIGSELYLSFPDFLFFPLFFSLGIGPVFYFYIIYLLRKDYVLKGKQILHLILPFIQFCYYITIFLKPVNERILHFQNEYFSFFLLIEDTLGIISFAAYFYFAYRILKKYQQSILNNYTDVRKILYKWLNHFIIFSYSMLLFWALTALVDFFIYDYTQTYSFYYPVYLWMIFILYWIIYKGFINTSKIQPDSAIEQENKTYSLPFAEIEDYLQKLTDVMERDKLYLKPKLTLIELAEKIEVNSKYLSQIINNRFNKSYTEFINQYRIEHAKMELLSIKNTHLTISAISENCGFNSKSTFNDVFKRYTNQTPTQYIKSNS